MFIQMFIFQPFEIHEHLRYKSFSAFWHLREHNVEHLLRIT